MALLREMATKYKLTKLSKASTVLYLVSHIILARLADGLVPDGFLAKKRKQASNNPSHCVICSVLEKHLSLYGSFLRFCVNPTALWKIS